MTSDTTPNRRLIQWFIGTAIFTFTVLLHITFPNMGGTGLRMPFNNAVWIGFTVMLALAMWPATRGVIRYSKFHIGLGLLLLALWLPFFWTWNEASLIALPRLLTVTAGAILLLGLAQLQLTRRDWWWLGMAILLGSMVEALFSFSQMYFLKPDNWFGYDTEMGRPIGIFQQPNVLGSFLATGLILSAWLFSEARHRLEQSITLIAAIIVPAALLLTYSRIGWLAAIICLPLALTYLRKLNTKRFLRWGSAVIMGCLLGGTLMVEDDNTPRSAEALVTSSSGRMPVYIHSVKMLAEEPLAGWGYGRFQHDFLHDFADWRASLEGNEETIKDPIITKNFHHPHNELLLWGIEGGLLPLLAILAFSTWVAITIIRKKQSGPHLILLASLIPIGIHTMTEFPFYASSAHWLTFILLLGALSEATWVTTQRGYRYTFSIKLLCTTFTPAIVFFFVTSTYTLWQVSDMFIRNTLPTNMSSIVNPIAINHELTSFIHQINLRASIPTKDRPRQIVSIRGLLELMETRPETAIYQQLSSKQIKYYDTSKIKEEAKYLYPHLEL